MAHIPSFLYYLFVLACFAQTCFALKGDHGCGHYMCVNATVIDDKVHYQIQPMYRNNEIGAGWVALGFGRRMKHSHMVILWENEDGSVTLSQRYAAGHRMPEVVDSPPRIATAAEPILPPIPSLADSKIYAFEIPLNKTFYENAAEDEREHHIWAFGIKNPGTPDVDADLVMHFTAGRLDLNLANDLPDGILLHSPTLGNLGDWNDEQSFFSHERIVAAHGFLLSVGFLLILPLGSLVARWGRTFTPKWFPTHRLLNFYIGLPVILIGWILGPTAVADAQAGHFMDSHQISGLGLFCLYIGQLYLGRYIHSRNAVKASPHPPSNILHVVFGCLIITLAFLQVRSGMNEWETAGHEPLSQGWFILWKAWAVIILVLYLAGLAFLKRQFHQENNGLMPSFSKQYIALSPRSNSPHIEDIADRHAVVFRASIDDIAEDATEKGEVNVPLLHPSHSR